MNTTRALLPLAALPLTALALAAALTGCGSDEPGARSTDPATSAESTATESVAAQPAALPITAHVVADLPGFEPQGRARAEDPRTFAKAHEKDLAELREAGFVSGSTLFFGGEGDDFALSIAAAYDDPSAATAEADRVFASNTEGDPSLDVSPLDLPGVPGAHAALLVGAQGGTDYTGVEIVFVSGTVLHEVFAVAESDRMDVDAMVAAATALHDTVDGHPLDAQ